MAPAAQQDAALLGVTQGVGKKILDDAAQHLGVAVDPQAGGDHVEIEAAIVRHDLEFGTQRPQDVGQRELAATRGECAGIELGDIEQRAQQLLGSLQGVVDVTNGSAVVGLIDLLSERRGEQPSGVQRLQQVVTGGGEEAGFGGVGILGGLLGLAQRLFGLGADPVLLT